MFNGCSLCGSSKPTEAYEAYNEKTHFGGVDIYPISMVGVISIF
jgi:hypothetical protein